MTGSIDKGWRPEAPPLQGRGKGWGLSVEQLQVVRVTNDDVMTNVDSVWTLISGALTAAPDRWNKPHPNPSPEGEGLEPVEAQKLLRVSLEGSVG